MMSDEKWDSIMQKIGVTMFLLLIFVELLLICLIIKLALGCLM